MFTFDMQTCMQNILQKMQDAEHYVQTIKKWQEDIAMYKEQIKQIETYYKQIEGIGEQLKNGTLSFVDLWEKSKNLLTTTDKVIEKSDLVLTEIQKETDKLNENAEKYIQEAVQKQFGDLITTPYTKEKEAALNVKNTALKEDFATGLRITNIERRIYSGESPSKIIEELNQEIELEKDNLNIINKNLRDSLEKEKELETDYNDSITIKGDIEKQIEIYKSLKKELEDSIVGYVRELVIATNDPNSSSQVKAELIASRENLRAYVEVINEKILFLEDTLKQHNQTINTCETNLTEEQRIQESLKYKEKFTQSSIQQLDNMKTYISGTYIL